MCIENYCFLKKYISIQKTELMKKDNLNINSLHAIFH